VEAYALTQMEDERSNVGLIPALCEGGGEVEARVPGDEAIEDQLVDMFRLAVGSDAGIEIGWAAVDEEDHGAGIALGGVTGSEEQECQGKDEGAR
jgi:hypothetical protein